MGADCVRCAAAKQSVISFGTFTLRRAGGFMDYRYLLIIPGLFIIIALKAVYDSFSEKRKTKAMLLSRWGKLPDKEYAAGKYESIQKYYESICEENDVDDITWNDLDMDDIYMLLDNTQSAMGEEMLYACLRKPLFDEKEIYYRDKIIDYFQKNNDDRITIQSKLRIIGSNRNISFYEFFSRLKEVKKESNIYHYIIDLAWIMGIAMLFVNTAAAVTILVVNVGASIMLYYKRKSQIEAYYSILNYVLRMLYCAKKLSVVSMPIIKNELDVIKGIYGKLSSFRRMSGIVLNPNGGNLLDIMLDYVRMLTHIDLIKFNRMLGTIIKKNDEILKLHETIGFLDVMIAAASYREMCNESGWCVPQITDDVSVDVSDIYNPMLDNPVYNSISTKGGILVTGSNASGKSTFLKAVAINAILAQTIATVNASSYKAACFRVMTSMALKDNLVNNQSYFIVEIMSLRRILCAAGKTPVLCCIDEVLRGTNTIERIAASSEILKKLNDEGVICFAATHDIELARILGRHYANYHFQEKIEDDKIIFDYILYDGCSVTKNAIKLLGLLEYEKEVVDLAKGLADTFEKTGIWPEI